MSNLHVDLDEANKHTPKGFTTAGDNTLLTKDEQGLSTYKERMMFDKAINFVDGTLPAPTTAEGDVYVLIGSGVIHASWGDADFDDWVVFRNTFPINLTPLTGYLCYDVTASQWMEFDGSDWVGFGGGVAVNTLYSANDTIGSGRVATLADTLTFKTGVNGKIELTNSSIEIFRELNGNSFFKVIDSGEASTLLLNSDGGRKVSLSTVNGGQNVLFNPTTIGYENPILGSTLALRTTSGASFRGYAIDLTKPTFEIGNLGQADKGELKLWAAGVGASGETYVKLTSHLATNSYNYLINQTGIGFYNGNESSIDATFHIRSVISTNAFLIQDSGLTTDYVKVLASNGYMGLGTDPTAKLHIKGTGPTSLTTALLVQNSASAELFKITDDGSLYTVGFQGFTGTGAYTNFTIKNGIITAAS